MIPPGELLKLPKFADWYPGQQEIWQQMMAWVAGDERFCGASVPTGFGKSLLAMLTAHFSGKRTVYLTSTTGLQTQLLDDFERLGLVDIRGRNRYQCIEFNRTSVDRAPCTAGYQCPVISRCHYYSQLDRAVNSQLVVSNYSYWMAQHEYGTGLAVQEHDNVVNPVELLILDEAHLISRSLESHLKVQFDQADREYLDWHPDWEYAQWRRHCLQFLTHVDEELQNLRKDMEFDTDRDTRLMNEHSHLSGLRTRCSRLLESGLKWVQEKGEDTISWTPLWTRDYNHLLFQKVPKILLMSAILTPRMMDGLGVEGEWIEAGSPFPPSQTPITHIPTVRVNHRTSDDEMYEWTAQIDRIIADRQDRKGIVFTVSYGRAEFLKATSAYSHQMFSHRTRNLAEVVEQFKRAAPPAVLVSPSVTTGWDFPGEEAEYIIVGKVPYPDTSNVLNKARSKEDPEWTAQLAMETLVQETGRGTRSEGDRCQVLVVDDSWKWWWPKYREFAPKWFRERVTASARRIPQPLPLQGE